MVNPRPLGHVEALLVRVLAVSKHTARVIRVGLAVLERLPVCPDNQTYSELVQTSLSGQQQTRALQQDALDFGFALAAMAAGSVQ